MEFTNYTTVALEEIGFIHDNSDDTTAAYVAVSAFGIPGNILAIIVILSSAQLRSKPINIFMVNQSAIDLTNCVFTLLNKIYDKYEMMPASWGFLRYFWCIGWVSTFLMWSVCCSSIYNLMFLTLERYYAITKPLKYDQDKVYRRLPLILTLAWVSGLIASIPVALFFEVIGDSCVMTVMLRFPDLFTVMTPFYISVLVMFPALVMVFAYIRMGIALGKSQFSSKGHKKAQMNLFQTCVILMLVFVLTGVNHCISLILFYIGYYPDTNNDQYHVGVVLVVFNSCVNPYVYCIRYKEFQDQAKYLLCRSAKEINSSSASIQKKNEEASTKA